MPFLVLFGMMYFSRILSVDMKFIGWHCRSHALFLTVIYLFTPNTVAAGKHPSEILLFSSNL